MSWGFSTEENGDIFIDVQGFRAKNQRGNILGKVEAIEIGSSADQLKVSMNKSLMRKIFNEIYYFIFNNNLTHYLG